MYPKESMFFKTDIGYGARVPIPFHVRKINIVADGELAVEAILAFLRGAAHLHGVVPAGLWIGGMRFGEQHAQESIFCAAVCTFHCQRKGMSTAATIMQNPSKTQIHLKTRLVCLFMTISLSCDA